MKKGYVINRLKGYSVRNNYFVPQPNGGLLFETSDPTVQALIESLPDFGTLIHPRETKEEIATMRKQERATKIAPPSPSPEEPTQLAHQGARGTLTAKGERGLMIIQGSK